VERPEAALSHVVRAPHQREEGAVAVEFALVALLFFVLLFGIIVYGVQFGARIAATQAASEGARAAVAGLTPEERSDLADSAARAVINRYGAIFPLGTVTVLPPVVTDERVEVTVRVDLSAFGFDGLASLLPLPSSQPQATVGVRVGGF
jgi:Flp pilus assembly protein TadG